MANLEAEALARELNFATANALRKNFSKCNGDVYIELTEPISNTKMISRSRDAQTFEEAGHCAQNCRIAGYEDWQLPTLEELELIYKLHVAFPELFPFNLTFWSSSAKAVDFLASSESKPQLQSESYTKVTDVNNVILVRREVQNQ